MTSSAGWKSSRTRPGSSPRRAPRPARGRRRAGRWCARRGRRRGRRRRPGCCQGSVVGSSTGQRVEVGAQRDQRSAPSPRSATSPSRRCGCSRQPDLRRGGRRPGRWCGVSCQDSSGWACRSRRRSSEVVGVLVDHGLDERERSVRGHVREVRFTGVGGVHASPHRSSYAARSRSAAAAAGSSPRSTRPRTSARTAAYRRASGAAAARARRGPAPR